MTKMTRETLSITSCFSVKQAAVNETVSGEKKT